MISLVKVKSSFYQLCKQYGVDNELLFNENGRPCVLLVKLRYKNRLQDLYYLETALHIMIFLALSLLSYSSITCISR